MAGFNNRHGNGLDEKSLHSGVQLDSSVWIGLILSVVIVVGAFAWLGLPFRMLFQPEALLIVFGGTATALLMNFSNRTGALLKEGIKNSLTRPTGCAEDAVELLTEIAQLVRHNGLLALQPIMDQIPSPFVRKGVQLMQDNRPPVLIQHALTTDMEVQYRQELDAARLFEAAGGFAPTLGIVGAVIGLMHVASSFDSPGQLTHGIASAFTATLYGVGLANLVCLPLAGRLKQQARDAWFQKTILTEGMMSIYAGDHPLVTEEKLRAFLNEIPTIPEGSSLRAGSFANHSPENQGLHGLKPHGALSTALKFGSQGRQATTTPAKGYTQAPSASLAQPEPPLAPALPSSVFDEAPKRGANMGYLPKDNASATRPKNKQLSSQQAVSRLSGTGRFGDMPSTSQPAPSKPLSKGQLASRSKPQQYATSEELQALAANDGWIR